MNLYKFRITGGSPFNGEVAAVAADVETAREMARNAVDEHNLSNHNPLTLEYLVDAQPFSGTGVVSFESGEQ